MAWEIGHREESVENFPRELFRKMADAGLFRIPFAAEVGGRGLKYPACATAALIEELAYHSNSVAAVVDVHCILAGHALEHASPALQQRYLAPLLAGEKIGSFATTEPDASTDLSIKTMQTFANREGGGYVVNGRKRFITNAPVADFVVLLCAEEGRMTEIVDRPGFTGRARRRAGPEDGQPRPVDRRHLFRQRAGSGGERRRRRRRRSEDRACRP